ncbi:MAG: thiamine-phosphate kinase [Ferrovum sp.]|nr:thiamine-phosphate kinase [Ferrovum sp.]NDU87707.1 thiamine-phosphate kinase [Ferrovum sp.]
MSEFDLIRRYFSPPTRHTLLAGGDDAALIAPRGGWELALSTDLLVAEHHFFSAMDPERLGYKAAAVNLSDMAAMGAVPRWVLLGITLPKVHEPWLDAFSRGFQGLLNEHGVDWIGGDTTAGPLSLAVTIIGEVPAGQALRRSGAQAGDDIWVSGTLGDAALGLDWCRGSCPTLTDEIRNIALDRFERPTPRLTLGQSLRGLAHAAIDVSDGLLADLGHILNASAVGAVVELEAIPVSPGQPSNPEDVDWQRRVLHGGEDYELCFTAPSRHRHHIVAVAAAEQILVTRIGVISAVATERVLRTAQGRAVVVPWQGYDHFVELS